MGFDDFGLGFDNPRFRPHARSYGAAGCRMDRAADLRPSPEQSFRQGGCASRRRCGGPLGERKVLNEEIPRQSAEQD